MSLHTNGFTEDGGEAALHEKGRTMGTTLTTLGLRAASTLDLGGLATTLRGSLGWRHAFGDTTSKAAQSFSAGQAFDVEGVAIAKDSTLIETGIDVALSGSATLGILYNGQIAADARQNAFKATLRLTF
ncbi:outer membrane autotransporter barrel domain-containing protein [Arboricoccus pini]|uniref:Outer membrane autotransporter barrel domain-containing protein n=1 Tax=Arboricoccus pini TaxID=1963835 RepID=A0A212PW80_9PROT|nr:outer membrane autotransporter barrel domain-containing protein [Arboricoccus pini]